MWNLKQLARPFECRHYGVYPAVVIEVGECRSVVHGGALEVGVFGLQAAIHPGLDRTTGQTDHFTDLGVDESVSPHIVPHQRSFWFDRLRGMDHSR